MEHPQLGNDQPKQNPWLEDKLGYADLAGGLARLIINLKPTEGYVFGVQGRWGMGKSSFVNFVLAYVRKYNEENIESVIQIIEFKPWLVSGHEGMVSAFFKVLSEKLQPSKPWKKRLRLFGQRYIDGNTDKLIQATAAAALSLEPTAGLAIKVSSAVAPGPIKRFFSKALAEPSIQARHMEIQQLLRVGGKKYLVVIDDIDRLERDEVKAIMQMVKSIGSLPNVIYVLSYDKAIVTRLLGDQSRNGEPQFMEKIVQHEVELPRVTRTNLLAMLNKETAFTGDIATEDMRWHHILVYGIYRWLRSPRDVIKLSNALKFAWPPLEAKMDRSDLLAMEGLKLFDSDVFDWIRQNRDLIFSEGRFTLGPDEEKVRVVEVLKQSIDGVQQKQILDLLQYMFPTLSKVIDQHHSHSEGPSLVISRRGIGCAAGYDTYFGFNTSTDDIPLQMFDTVFSSHRYEDILEIFRILIPQRDSSDYPKVGTFLYEINARLDSGMTPVSSKSLIKAIFSVGDELASLDYSRSLFALAPRGQCSALLYKLLQSLGEEAAGAELIKNTSESNAPAFCSDVVVDRARELGVIQDKGTSWGEPVVTLDTLNRIVQLTQEIIERQLKDNVLQDAHYYFNIVRVLHLAGGKPVADTWLSNGVRNSVTFLAKAALGIMSYSLGTKERNYNVRGDAGDFDRYPVKAMLEAAERFLKEGSATDDQMGILKALVRDLPLIIQGRE